MEPKAVQNFLQYVKDGLFDPVSSFSPIKPNTMLSTLAATRAPLHSQCELPDAQKCVSTPCEPQTTVSGDRQSDVDKDGCVMHNGGGGGDEDRGGGVDEHDIQRAPNDEDPQRNTDKGREGLGYEIL